MAIQKTLITTAATAIMGPVPGGKTYAALLINFHNYHATIDTYVNVWVVKSGDTSGVDNRTHRQKILAGGTWELNAEKWILEAGDQIMAAADDNSAVNANVSQFEV